MRHTLRPMLKVHLLHSDMIDDTTSNIDTQNRPSEVPDSLVSFLGQCTIDEAVSCIVVLPSHDISSNCSTVGPGAAPRCDMTFRIVLSRP